MHANQILSNVYPGLCKQVGVRRVRRWVEGGALQSTSEFRESLEVLDFMYFKVLEKEREVNATINSMSPELLARYGEKEVNLDFYKEVKIGVDPAEPDSDQTAVVVAEVGGGGMTITDTFPESPETRIEKAGKAVVQGDEKVFVVVEGSMDGEIIPDPEGRSRKNAMTSARRRGAKSDSSFYVVGSTGIVRVC